MQILPGLVFANVLAALPFRLEYMPWWQASLLFAALAAPILWLGMRSLNGLGPARKWVAISVRLFVLLLFILLIGGLRWQRQHKDVEVMVLRDISRSTTQVKNFPGQTLQQSLDEFLTDISHDKRKKPDDRIGVISFNENALIDAMPSKALRLDVRAIRESGTGTDVADAIQLALATMSRDAMHRLLLVWDGNMTAGDLDTALAAAEAQHIPIDVMPLHYDVQNEVLLERFITPAWKRENEPFTIDVILRSTNAAAVTGNLTVLHQDEPLDMDLNTRERDTTRRITLKPGLNVEHVKVPALQSAGVHQFRAIFDAKDVSIAGDVTAAQGDTLDVNNSADAFTFVRGKGAVLYVDNVYDERGARGPGNELADALKEEGIVLNAISVDQFPTNIVKLQDFDAIVLANVPRGSGGMNDIQDKMLSSYVHEMGGGLLMIGGPDTFGAGGWQGSEVEKILPVDMEIPAERQVGKGALVLVMHSCEMPRGNYWGEQCAIKAIEALSDQDEIGVISYGWGANNPNGVGGSSWDFPLATKGDGSKVLAAVKKMQLGDMPSFDDSMTLALKGANGQGGLIRSNARHKHVIIISDGDPQRPQDKLMAEYKAAKVSVSTVTVYPHMGGADGLPPTMKQIAEQLGGRAYGPINADPSQLPQIFIKEATIVRRSLIHEDQDGIPLRMLDGSDEMVKGVADLEPVFGMVLTSRKNDPRVQMPVSAGKNNDPVLAHWQAGLGKSAVFASDAHNRWAVRWVASPVYSKFWAQVVRKLSRPPMSTDFEVQTTQSGDKGKIIVEAVNKDDEFLNFLTIGGAVLGPDMKERKVRLVQTGPGTYQAEFDMKEPGSYAVALSYQGRDGKQGSLRTGLAMNSSPELRELRSNEARLREIAEKTGGRLMEPFVPTTDGLFSREGLTITASPMPVWDILLPVLVGMILIDVATRRIAWDRAAMKRMALAGADRVRAFTLVRKVEAGETMDALKRVREEVAEQKFRPAEIAGAEAAAASATPRPDPKAKFQAKGVEGDISTVVGGATDKPIPPPPKKIEPKGAPGAGHTGSLLEAKRRAQQVIKQKEQGE